MSDPWSPLSKLLPDENLSPSVALCRDGVDVAHVRDRGLTGATDAEVDDFDKLGRARELHAGIILIEDGALLRDEQETVVRQALIAIQAELDRGRDMVNRALRIDLAAAARTNGPPSGIRP